MARAQLALDQAVAPAGPGRGDAASAPCAAERRARRRSSTRPRPTCKKTEAQVEADQANLEQAEADYETNILAAKASVAQAKAEVRNAEIDLGYCRITAPIDGRISRALYDVGNLVGDGQATVLATIVRTTRSMPTST